MDQSLDARKATQKTAANLRTVARTQEVRKLSRLSLPEIDKVVELVAQVVPAGNVPGMILSGLTRLPGRRLPPQKVQQDINALFQGVEQVWDRAMYGAFVAGPAAIIWGYQNLLRLAGRDPESSFPEGTWQFYVDYALREDTARHANETHGFDTLLRANEIQLSAADRAAAWVMAAVTCLHQFDALLANEWYERVATSLLLEETMGTPRAARFAELYDEWQAQRPYRREADAAQENYPTYRRRKFDEFLKQSAKSLPAPLRAAWEKKLRAAVEQDLPAYQKQLSILAYLEPGSYGETRVPITRAQAHIGIIHKGNYFLLPICEPGTDKPLDVRTARAQVTAILSAKPAAPANLSVLARIQRAALAGLRGKLNPTLAKELKSLRLAPILLNTDARDRALPLSELHQAERGIGDHALTIFDTGETFVFDQSHIFFDGAWGAALAEIMTGEALSWAHYLSMLPRPGKPAPYIYTVLTLPLHPADLALIQKAPRIPPEASAETKEANLKACQSLRKLFKRRSDLLDLTINDLLVLYRAIHAATYRPSSALGAELDKLAKANPAIAAMIRKTLDESNRVSPSILIPMDASRRVPRDRLYPLNVEVPLAELDLLGLHARTLQALDAYEQAASDREALYKKFDNLQKYYLATLAGFGAILSKAKEIARRGESASVGAIKLLAHLPLPLQRLLDKVPEKFEVLNNMLKGSEVLSNVGAVARTSSLTRFITAKDDNHQKQLAWGVITDAGGIMHINLRDFRPHVAALREIGRKDLADLIAQDYLDAYAIGLNQYVRDVARITRASRETQTPSRKQKRF